MHTFASSVQDVGIYRRVDITVAEEFLYSPDGIARLEQVRRE